MKNTVGDVATAALDTLQGARKLPAEQAVQRLREFLEALRSSGTEGDRLTDALAALKELVDSLDQHGIADNDSWQQAIETMVSLVNDPN